MDQISDACENPNEIKALQADVKGRVTKSLEGLDRYFRWGGHYLRSLMRAH